MKLLILLMLSLSAFAQKIPSRLADDNITWELAEKRKSQVKSVKYNLHFEFHKGAPGFNGKSEMMLELTHTNSDLSIDSMLKEISSLKVNGIEIKKFPKRLGSFDIPKNYLRPQTVVEIQFKGVFNKDASGIQRVTDSEDGSEYIYTDFEPYHSHKFFPNLDQPDLKAVYEVSVRAPSEWLAIQNELVSSSEVQGEMTLTKFRPTKPISSYLFFLGVGPFVEWKDQMGDLPIYLYARKTMAKYVDVENIMEATKKGLKFFNEYFDYPYPFSKYGQIFIPEFAWGGMENPGAVTLNERGIFRGPVPQSRREGRNNLILHEMAHMWFGDLVTMQWWNDLWLNESFATYLASMAQERALGSQSTWMEFFGDKTWGYWQDQLITTHPIETLVPDVRSARGNFDGITYSKGASALKQLHFFVGDKAFRDGLRAYFKKYAFSNTKREDFISSIGNAARMDLGDWTSKWLQTSGPNRVKLQFECKDDEITKITLHQTPSVSGTLSPHRTRIALYKLKGEKFKLIEHEDVAYSKEVTEIKDLKDEDCPDFAFPNMDDHDYALYSLDPKSLSNARSVLLHHPSSLVRMMIWHMLYQMVRDSELKATAYLEHAVEGLKTEKDDLLLGEIIGRWSIIRSVYQSYLTREQRAQLAPALEGVIWERVLRAEKGSSLQMSFFDFYISLAQTPESQMRIYEMLTKNTPPEGLVLDQDRRWALILNLSSHGHKEALSLVDIELKKDASSLGKRMALSAKAAFPDKKLKQKMWTMIEQSKSLSHSDKMEAGRWLYDSNYPELIEIFEDQYLKKISSMNWKANDELVEVYFERLFPGRICSAKFEKASKERLNSAKNLSALAKRNWLEAQDELERCVRVKSGLP